MVQAIVPNRDMCENWVDTYENLTALGILSIAISSNLRLPLSALPPHTCSDFRNGSQLNVYDVIAGLHPFINRKCLRDCKSRHLTPFY